MYFVVYLPVMEDDGEYWFNTFFEALEFYFKTKKGKCYPTFPKLKREA